MGHKSYQLSYLICYAVLTFLSIITILHYIIRSVLSEMEDNKLFLVPDAAGASPGGQSWHPAGCSSCRVPVHILCAS